MSTRKALSFSFLDRYAALVLSIGSSMIVARLLTPAEIGVFSVTTGFLIVLTALRDMGAGQYLIQERELDPAKIRAAWSVSLGTGLVASLVVAALAVPVSRFYAEPRMVPIMLVIALNFALNPFGSLTYAWLMRQMRFESLAAMRFLAGLSNALVTVALAWHGEGPISLALGSLAATLVNGLVSAWHRPKDFPLLPGRAGLAIVLRKGVRFSGSGLVGGVGSVMPELILGKLESLTAAALYSRANGLSAIFQKLVLDATQVVAVSMFAQESRTRGNVAASFVRSSCYVSAIGWSFFAGLALLAHPAVLLLYGAQWEPAVPVARWMALAAMIGLPTAMCSTVLLGIGEASLMFRTTLATAVTQAACGATGAAVAGLHGAAVGATLAALLANFFWLRATHRAVGFTWRDLGAAFAPSAGVAAITALGPVATVAWFGLSPSQTLAPLALAAGLGTALFVLAVFALRHPLSEELRRVRARIGSARPSTH